MRRLVTCLVLVATGCTSAASSSPAERAVAPTASVAGAPPSAASPAAPSPAPPPSIVAAALPPEPTPPPSEIGVGAAGAGSTPCATDDDCVLVTGGCSSAFGAHRDDARDVDADRDAILSVSECAGGHTVPTRARCDGARCVAVPLDHPEWRECVRDRDCALEFRDCRRWEPVARRSADVAHAAWTGPVCPSIVPTPPEVRCRYQRCTVGWAGRD